MKISALSSRHAKRSAASSSTTQSALKVLLVLAFWPVTATVLYCDSANVAQSLAYGQWLSNGLALLYLGALISQMPWQRRVLAVIFVPFSAVGEVIFTMLLGLYQYRLGAIPLYVPLGHSILLSVGLAIGESDFAELHQARLQGGLIAFHALLVGGTLVLFGDTLSAVLLTIFFIMLCYIPRRTTYLVIGILVLYIELLGTMWRCWTWGLSPFGSLHTTNPPTGAFACYVIADLIAVKVATLIEAWWLGRRSMGLAVEA